MRKIFENFKTVKFPEDDSSREVMDNLENAKTKLQQLEGKENLDEADLNILNRIYNTGAYEVSKLREKYKTDVPVSDFERTSLKRKFNWDDKKVMSDPANKSAQDLMERAGELLDKNKDKNKVRRRLGAGGAERDMRVAKDHNGRPFLLKFESFMRKGY